MLTKIKIRNFKRFDVVEIPLDSSTVFIGPNNSGKTAALQALALWDVGLRRWQERYKGKTAPEKRPGVTINRRDLIAIPIPRANLLWRDLRTRLVTREAGKQRTDNVRIDIIVEGISYGKSWLCGLEFDYANEESFYCRPLRSDVEEYPGGRMPVPDQALQTKVAYLPPMSGLAAIEPKWELGRVNVLIGEGQTAQVLRNLCYSLAEDRPEDWNSVQRHIQELFRVKLDKPVYIAERGEITMSYRESSSYSESAAVSLALSSSGRGLQQTLLLLAYLYTNSGAVFLIDEPDAHLEILRQRQIYGLLLDIASQLGSQIVAASHSEVVLNEAAAQDAVVAFVGKPHRIADSTAQVLKALGEIEQQDYYHAEYKGWVLYVEGQTDLPNLRAFANILSHDALKYLDRPFVKYVGNQPKKARDHFYGLREAKSDLVGISINVRDAPKGDEPLPLLAIQWKRKEIENYFAIPSVLLRYAGASVDADPPGPEPLFSEAIAEERKRRVEIMEDVIKDNVIPAALRDPAHRFWQSDNDSEFLDEVIRKFCARLNLYNRMSKTAFHRLAALAHPDELDQEVTVVLDQIVQVAQQAKPASG